ncbi:MAG: nucleotidyltransferase domain-containing protein, partial [Candidatus Bipolaricaulota bacterium]|nr:nucleotidyltransferase domain-containing protein [Candidatus Bipolaricaulota bacterium]
ENLTSVVLFGSVARGEAHARSDIDLFVVARALPKGAFRRRGALEPVRARLEPELAELWKMGIYTDFAEILRTEVEARRFHALYLDMTEEAVVLYERGGFLAEVLERVRGKLRELGAQCKRLGKAWYWDLKPDYKPGEAIDLSL